MLWYCGFYEDCKRDIEFSLTFFYILIFSVEVTSSQIVVFVCGVGMYHGSILNSPFLAGGPSGTFPEDMLLSVEDLSFSQSAESAHAGERGTDGVQATKRYWRSKSRDVPVHSKCLLLLPLTS